jgi:hypothetical protein
MVGHAHPAREAHLTVHDQHLPVLHHRRVHHVGGRGCRVPRHQGPHHDGKRHHRRETGEVRIACSLRAAALARNRAARIPADDDACQSDGRGRDMERVRVRQFRQSIVRAERRVEYRGDEPRARSAVPQRFRAGPARLETVGSRQLAQAVDPREITRAVLELFRGSVFNALDGGLWTVDFGPLRGEA